jgi:hypothetical protein
MAEKEVERGVKFQTGVPNVAGSGGKFGWAKDQYVPPVPPFGRASGQISGFAASSLINWVNCASEYDSIDCKLAGEFGIIEVVVDVVASWAWTSIIPAMLATPKRAATTNDFLGETFIGSSLCSCFHGICLIFDFHFAPKLVQFNSPTVLVSSSVFGA